MTRALKWWLSLALVLVFLAGVATGLLAGARHARSAFVSRHGPQMAERMREHLRRELDLTPEQAEKIAPVIDRTARQLEAIRVETSGRVAEAMNASRAEIAPVLTPEQMERLDRLRERHQRMLRRHHFGRAPRDEP